MHVVQVIIYNSSDVLNKVYLSNSSQTGNINWDTSEMKGILRFVYIDNIY